MKMFGQKSWRVRRGNVNVGYSLNQFVVGVDGSWEGRHITFNFGPFFACYWGWVQ